MLSSTSFDQRFGTVSVSGFLVSMPEVFEDFVCAGLRVVFERHGGRGRLQWPGFLDEARVIPIRPDLVWELDGSPRMVADAKYKSEKPAGFPQADLYQLLAYCTALDLTDGHLVYARVRRWRPFTECMERRCGSTATHWTSRTILRDWSLSLTALRGGCCSRPCFSWPPSCARSST